MISAFYGSLLAASLLCTVIYFFIWQKYHDVNFALLFTFLPIGCLGYWLYSMSRSEGEAILAQKVTYIGGCFLQLFVLLCILNLCQVEIRKWTRGLLYAVCATEYASVLTIGYTGLFYKETSFEMVGGYPVLTRSYGFMHSVFYVTTLLFFAAGIAVILYSWFKKKQVPRTIIYLLLIPDTVSMFCYFIGRRLNDQIDMVPVGYLLAQIMYLIIANRASLYNAGNVVMESMVREREIGFLSFDFKYRYLSSNRAARQLLPEISRMAVDNVLGGDGDSGKLRHYLDHFKSDPTHDTYEYTLRDPGGDEEKDRYYTVNVNDLYDGTRKRGYIVTFTDDTANKKYIRLLDSYNEELQSEVDEKTRHIVEMHDNLIMSLAMMVESRDNSTGGHIKRTSEGVRILIDVMKEQGDTALDEEFCRDVIKAAPMHDLGKIAVDDAVLRKPGRFTPEEFDKMKKHAAEGARVIHKILLNTDDNSFKTIAENVAHYHHERWDGSGYPEGLAGEEIPFEARIMAIADVYDALVSKRVYKEAFDFEKANAIITEGMGVHFDPGLAGIYEKARPRLEAYYEGQE